MCGIFAYISSKSATTTAISACIDALKARGPDASHITIPYQDVTLGFTRLAINGLTSAGMQPLISHDIHVICNGEIYNYKDLATRFNFSLHTGSDCEIISHLLNYFGVFNTARALDGVFACVAIDIVRKCVYVARDPYGVRPLFVGTLRDGGYVFASELKGIIPVASLLSSVAPFPPGHVAQFTLDSVDMHPVRYHQTPWLKIPAFSDRELARNALRTALMTAVNKRLMAERPFGCLLSGGLDSSLVAALVQRCVRQNGGAAIHTFCIGMPGSTDVAYAKLVAAHIGSIHHEVILTEDDFFNAIPEVVKAIESYDITTVRASVGNYLISKYVSTHTDIKILMNGDGSDECGSYMYFYNAPSDEEFETECIRLLDEIYLYDVLRSDRSISSNGLEARTPFLDKQFIATYLAIPTAFRRPVIGKQIEKQLLREAFDPKYGCPGDELLPSAVLWRKKEAFSDGVSPAASSETKPWHQRISDKVQTMFTSELLTGETSADMLTRLCSIYTHCPPTSFESLWYRRLFEEYYGHDAACVIPHMWLPRWCGDKTDPSATVLDVYRAVS